ncbi:5-oxoprolinase subunit PxpB [Marinobacterium sediminicola]|uniref:Sensor histidine kinase inhibitor, KipI family n=1 Tax=Marinobacterium sediminicola TaxID=518898 RepID=A0ABY1S271_9GAMM|nr:5-oxoprolinase subunit PxpB [Marinobacterium sediminicola]ULG68519.1 5-oxoprolinase subunit PxpB [Marinobacterium sediminicola]SMR76654.1 sensor histidine kinase inhibitor, KipI family [Marinobacterium sediminicola]
MIRMHPVNENTWILYPGDEISETVAAHVARLTQSIRASLGHCLVDIIPSYTSVLVSFDLQQADRFAIESRLKAAIDQSEALSEQTMTAREVVLPVYYGPEAALDMEHIARECQLTPEEVVRLHSEQIYRVYAIGFSPGFAYLGNTPEPLRIARKSTPRLKVPAGSLGIADNQTAIYPSQTPGGWQIIGRTPLEMIDWDSETLTRVNVGDRVRFEPVDRDTFISMGGRLDEL